MRAIFEYAKRKSSERVDRERGLDRELGTSLNIEHQPTKHQGERQHDEHLPQRLPQLRAAHIQVALHGKSAQRERFLLRRRLL